jgi:iron complex outermembrane receptor protein
MSFLLGLRGEISNNLRWDISAYRGENEADFFINNTLNASLGPDSPRDFDPGLYKQTDTNFNADLSWTVSDALNIGFGGEFRNEEFEIGAGQVESYTAGILADQGFSTSSNGFPGFPAATSGTFERENFAFYVDAEWTPTDRLVTQAAIRFEDFDGFGDTTNYKIGANWAITDNFGIRSTYSTGFKAPTPGQANASNTSTELTNVNGVPTLINNGTIPATNPVALQFGGKELDPEESTNFTAGLYATLGNFEITVDYYDIDLEDRINLSSEVVLTQDQIDQLVADNVPGAGDLTQFRFFTNDFDTNTHGVDVVVSTYTEWLGGTTAWNLAFNNNKTEVEGFNPETVGAGRIRQIERTTPETRWNLSANHSVGNFRVLARLSFYDEWYDSFENDVFGTDAVFDSEYLLDLEVEYMIGDHSSILIGGNNVLDNNGQKATDVNNLGFNTATILGNTYSQYSPFGISGAFWYARYRYNF